MKSGVYAIICRITNKFYIGSSKNVSKRLNHHFRSLKNKTHKNPHLQNAWNLYGEDSFYSLIVEHAENNIEREQFWIEQTQCYLREVGFNNTRKADAPFGYRHTKKAREKMSLIKKEQYAKGVIVSNFKNRKERKHSEATKEKIRLGKLGELNPMYGRSLTKEQRKVKGINLNSVPRWNKGKTSKDDPRIAKLATWKGKLPPNAKKCCLVNKQTNEKVFANSLKELAQKSNIPLVSINRITKDKSPKYKHYKIIYESRID
jgi:group I intron endonuclease